MKIISNYKDYYDYLQGIYGIDNKIIYKRLCQKIPLNLKDNWKSISLFKNDESLKLNKYIISICGINHLIFVYNNKYYYGDDGVNMLIDKFYSIFTKSERTLIQNYYYINKNKTSQKYNRSKWYYEFYKSEHLSTTTLNDKYNCPIILKTNFYYIKNIKLSDFDINKHISAHDIYLMISNFISKSDTFIDKRTDIDKIQSHGFDKITSFRKM